MKKYWKNISRFWNEEDAPTMAEYGLLLVFIAVVVVAGATLLGTGINTLFTDVATTITGS